METSLMVNDYPEENIEEEEMITVKVECSFTTYVTVKKGNYRDPEEEYDDIKEQIQNKDMYDLLEECDKVNIEDFTY